MKDDDGGGDDDDDDDDDDDKFNKCYPGATELSVRTATLLQLKKLQAAGYKNVNTTRFKNGNS